MSSTAWRVRAAVLLAAGALVVHELRYVLTFGPHAEHALAVQGHAYLQLAVPLVTGLLACLSAELVRRWAGARRAPDTLAAASMRRLWLGASIALLAIYTGQESLEGWLEPGHPGGLAGVFGHGGWVVATLVVLVGALVALALRGSAITLAGGTVPAPRRAPSPPASPWPAPAAAGVNPLARFLAGRGPPLASRV